MVSDLIRYSAVIVSRLSPINYSQGILYPKRPLEYTDVSITSPLWGSTNNKPTISKLSTTRSLQYFNTSIADTPYGIILPSVKTENDLVTYICL